MRKVTTILLLFLCMCSRSFAQLLPPAIIQQIDSLFREWNTPGSPGCVLGIVRQDSLIYAKGYGAAVLEHDIPLTERSVFNIASLSKQFTGYAVAMLANRGMLDLDEDVRHYLPWVPDLKARITVRHLVHHSSGLRDHLGMALYGGTGYNGLIA